MGPKKKKAARHLPLVNCAILTKSIIPVEGRSVKGILGWVPGLRGRCARVFVRWKSLGFTCRCRSAKRSVRIVIFIREWSRRGGLLLTLRRFVGRFVNTRRFTQLWVSRCRRNWAKLWWTRFTLAGERPACWNLPTFRTFWIRLDRKSVV